MSLFNYKKAAEQRKKAAENSMKPLLHNHHFRVRPGYKKLKVQAKTPFRTISYPICRQVIHVVNLTDFKVYNFSNLITPSNNRRKGEHMIVKNSYVIVCNTCIISCKKMCPVCDFAVPLDDTWSQAIISLPKENKIFCLAIGTKLVLQYDILFEVDSVLVKINAL